MRRISVANWHAQNKVSKTELYTFKTERRNRSKAQQQRVHHAGARKEVVDESALARSGLGRIVGSRHFVVEEPNTP